MHLNLILSILFSLLRWVCFKEEISILTALLPAQMKENNKNLEQQKMIYVNILFAVIVLQHTGCLCDAVIALLKVPLSFQRYFFQKLQSTSIKV